MADESRQEGPSVRQRATGTELSCALRTSASDPGEDDMSETSNDKSPADERDHEAKRREIAEVDDELDAEADGDGLAAEAGRGEETGLAEG